MEYRLNMHAVSCVGCMPVIMLWITGAAVNSEHDWANML